MAVGCCHNFKKCSDAGSCLYEISYEVPGDIDYETCLYKENLDKGLNFYTEYNENNKRKRDNFEDKTLKAEQDKVDFINKKVGTKTYIEIPNRLFLIGERVYGGWSRNLDSEDRRKLFEILKSKNIVCYLKELEDMFLDEQLEANKPCNSRVIVKINDKEYVIQLDCERR